MAKNKMEEVAAIFGKKLGEPFDAYELGKNRNHISITSNGEPIGNHVMFSERGVVYVDAPEDEQDWLLICLLTGRAKIVEEKPKVWECHDCLHFPCYQSNEPKGKICENFELWRCGDCR